MNTSSQFPNLMGPTALPGLAQRMTKPRARSRKEKGDRAYRARRRAATDGAADGADPAEARPGAAGAIDAIRRPVNAPLVLLAKCRACSHHRDPREFVGGPIAGVCWHCYEKHVEGIAMLAGNPPQGCQVCYRTIAQLEELDQRQGKSDSRLVLERKDGIFQILCLECDGRYQSRGCDLYGKTPYGQAKQAA